LRVDVVLHYNKNLKSCSRDLRKNMTEAEKFLWSRIRGKQLNGHQFYRQKIIGDFIVDFYCPRARLIIELDGGQHFAAEGKEKDRKRDNFMIETGLTVLRFSDREVFENIEGVLEIIWKTSSLENLP